jgi:hypothetical protein
VLVRVVVVAYGLAVLFFSTYRNGKTPRSFSVRARSPFSLLLGYSFCAFSALVFAQTFNWNEIFRISALTFYLATSGCVLLLCLRMAFIQYFTQQKLPNLITKLKTFELFLENTKIYFTFIGLPILFSVLFLAFVFQLS